MPTGPWYLNVTDGRRTRTDGAPLVVTYLTVLLTYYRIAEDQLINLNYLFMFEWVCATV